MKIIDILNKIANNKEFPKKIKYNDETYNYYGSQIGYSVGGQTTSSWNNLMTYVTPNTINDEVEVLEEETKKEKKIPEKISVWYEFGETFDKELTKIMLDELKNKYNEIIDFLNGKGE